MDRPLTNREYVETTPVTLHHNHESHGSGVSWGAVAGGAFVGAALYLTLLALGAGFGLSVISPWSSPGSHTAGDVAAIIWLLIMSAASSALGGYLTGRLRTKWATIHTDEVYFRDTANGFLSWAVAVVASAALLASAAAFMASGHTPRTAEGVAAESGPEAYYADQLFRAASPANSVAISMSESAVHAAAVRAEAGRILAAGVRPDDTMLAADQAYLAQLVAANTGLPYPDAQRRVADTLAQARQAADDARKATARILLWLFVSFLLGAFSASFAATIGGRQRDHVPAV